MTPPLDLDALRKLAEKATPGPWAAETGNMPDPFLAPVHRLTAERPSGPSYPGFVLGGVEEPNDAALIVAAVNALPALLDEIESLRAAAKLLQDNFPKTVPAPMDKPRVALWPWIVLDG